MVIHDLLLKVVVLGALLVPFHNYKAEADDLMTKPGCRSSCGHLVIPYPFGSSDSSSDCRIDRPSFIVYCDDSVDPPVPYLTDKSINLQIRDIFVESHEMRLIFWTGQDCYNSSGYDRSLSNYPWISLPEFPFSSTKNKFTAVGCDTLAAFQDRLGRFSFGCMSLCSSDLDVINGSCSGIGCCETSIPRNTFNYNISIMSFSNHSNILDFNPCSYAFVAEIGSYNFSVGDIKQLKFKDPPLVVDWAIGNQTCEEAKKNSTSYMCKKNTNCTDAENGFGYKCVCLQGYQGNPYLENGCYDIDECADPTLNQCEVKCLNIEGSYAQRVITVMVRRVMEMDKDAL
ncbi:hypothetical protein BT93_A0095 [Corymbia citriodora subsp. variegata]|nr:hypothetical protein BT93_A0095 [Corymbia citriodora subsp. variegata]